MSTTDSSFSKGLAHVFVFVFMGLLYHFISIQKANSSVTKTVTAPQPSERSRRAKHMRRWTASFVNGKKRILAANCSERNLQDN